MRAENWIFSKREWMTESANGSRLDWISAHAVTLTLGAIYVLVALPLVVFLVFKTPVFQVPDEPAHFIRAYQVAMGDWFPRRKVGASGTAEVGGPVDENLIRLAAVYNYLPFHPERRIEPIQAQEAEQIRWGQERWMATPSVSIYGPFLYLPQALGIALGKWRGWSIAETLWVSRVLNAVTSLLVAGLAISVAARGKVVIALLLLFPMVLAQFASASQDSLLIATAALCAALLSRAELVKGRGLLIHVGAAAFLLILMSTARPPYIVLSAAFLMLAWLKRSDGVAFKAFITGFLASFLGSVVWALYVFTQVSVPVAQGRGVNYAEQMKMVLTHPLNTLWITAHSFWVMSGTLATEFVARLGWLDVSFPQAYVLLAIIVLGSLFFLEWRRVGRQGEGRERMVRVSTTAVILLGTCGAVATAMYVTWTPVGAPLIEGMQGRYFIPIAFFSLLVLRPAPGQQVWDKTLVAETGLWVIFSVATLMTVPWAIGLRYY